MERYRDLEDVIYKGFISFKVKVRDTTFVLKSVSDFEHEMIKLRSGLEKDSRYTSNFHLNYLFYSIFMINGSNILHERDDHYFEFMRLFKEFSPHLVTKLFEQVEYVIKRLERSSKLLEPYCYEEVSRYNWFCKRNLTLNCFDSTGIKGTEQLGLNSFQKYWQVMNIREDEKDHFDEQYSLARFVASFWDSKAVRRIENSEKNKKEEEQKRRERIRKIGTPEEMPHFADPTDTREGIIQELEKQMRGEKDKHDLIVEKYEKELRTKMIQQMIDLKKMKEARSKSMPQNYESVRAISAEELAERLKRRKDKPKIKYYNEQVNSEQRSKYLQMSNVTNEDVINDGLLSLEEYNDLITDDMFNSVHSPIIVQENKDKVEKASLSFKHGLDLKQEELNEVTTEIEKTYRKEQNKLAYRYGLDEDIQSDLDFPHLRNK